jgi:hypothetical protein
MIAVYGGQEDRTFDMYLQVDTWRCRPLMIHVCVHRISLTKTWDNLVYPSFSKPHTDEGTKVLIFRVGDLVVLQKRYLLTHEVCYSHVKHTNRHRPNRCFCFLTVTTQLYFRTLWKTCLSEFQILDRFLQQKSSVYNSFSLIYNTKNEFVFFIIFRWRKIKKSDWNSSNRIWIYFQSQTQTPVSLYSCVQVNSETMTQVKDERSTCLSYTWLCKGLEHLKIQVVYY